MVYAINPNYRNDKNVKTQACAQSRGTNEDRVEKKVQRNLSRESGYNVANYLVGYTTDAEQGLTKRIITEDVNAKNVMTFLSGYEENKGLGNSFFEQLRTEYGFREQQYLMKNVADKLSKYLKAAGEYKLAYNIDSIISSKQNGFKVFYKEDAAKFDEIVQTMLEKEKKVNVYI